MINTVFGYKKSIGQAFEDGKRFSVTKIGLLTPVVTCIMNPEKNGYWSIQLGLGTRKAKHTSKPLQGHLKKISQAQEKTEKFPRYLREIRLDKEPEYKVGDSINISEVLAKGDTVSVSGISKGKGFAGGMKLHNFHGGPKTHGQSDRERAPGSVGQTTTPGRIYKGKKMAARMGSNKVTVKNLKVFSFNPETNELLVTGPVPGVFKRLVTVTKLN